MRLLWINLLADNWYGYQLSVSFNESESDIRYWSIPLSIKSIVATFFIYVFIYVQIWSTLSVFNTFSLHQIRRLKLTTQVEHSTTCSNRDVATQSVVHVSSDNQLYWIKPNINNTTNNGRSTYCTKSHKIVMYIHVRWRVYCGNISLSVSYSYNYSITIDVKLGFDLIESVIIRLFISTMACYICNLELILITSYNYAKV